MGTITKRKRSDGTTGYTAQIRLKKNGVIIHSESATFGQERLAKEWLKRREGELELRRAKGQSLARSKTLKEVLDWYASTEHEGRPWGRSKRRDITRLAEYPIALGKVDGLTRADYIAFVRWRRETVTAATPINDMVWFRNAMKAAEMELQITTSRAELDMAWEYCFENGLLEKPEERTRRVSPEEEKLLLAEFAERDRRSIVQMRDVFEFALNSGRRLSEITRLEWTGYDAEHHTVVVTKVKHPKRKQRNDREAKLTAKAVEIIERQPRDSRFIFPYNPASIGDYFRQATAKLGIEDMVFHDSRHEATSRLFEAGYQIHEVQQFTLHDSWKTLARYTHLSPKKLKLRD